MLVLRRPLDGFLGGLWEFPSVPSEKGTTDKEDVASMMAEKTGLTIARIGRLTRIRHAYTHFSLSGDVHLFQYVAGRVRLKRSHGHRWVTLRSLARLPLHKANHKFLDALTTAIAAMGDRQQT